MFSSDDARWAAIQARDPTADRAFVYCVRTTKIYCRPICKARLARRSNVLFQPSPEDARKAGYRPCKRCKPDIASSMPEEVAVKRVRQFLAQSPSSFQLSNLETMARQSKLSKWHFHRVFKKIAGITPSEYAKLCRTAMNQAWQHPRNPESPFDFGDQISEPTSAPGQHIVVPDFDWEGLSTSLFTNPASGTMNFDIKHLQNYEVEGIGEFDLSDIDIYFDIKPTSFGLLLLAFESQRICMIHQATSEVELVMALEKSFPSILYNHKRLNSIEVDAVSERIGAIVQMLERPVAE
jgi:methylphosphotriester-DNA--protein-cysteine methyltransferase